MVVTIWQAAAGSFLRHFTSKGVQALPVPAVDVALQERVWYYHSRKVNICMQRSVSIQPRTNQICHNITQVADVSEPLAHLAEALRVRGPEHDDFIELVRGLELADLRPHLRSKKSPLEPSAPNSSSCRLLH